MSQKEDRTVPAGDLVALASDILEAVGTPHDRARTVAESLVEADLQGVTSHGVMLLPMYVDRIRNGSVIPSAKATVISDSGTSVILDAGHGLGQPSSDTAMSLAIEKAQDLGTGITAVRHAFHFGMARRYALQAADADCIGIAMCNTRPLMPAPGGAERLVGNNPVAIALPTAGRTPLVLDLAMSEAAMGKIRFADQTGEPIPDTWATDSSGVPTTDPAAAIDGMLLPFGGHKGFGLALMVDLLCGLLSGGSWGPDVKHLYGDSSVPYDCSHLFLAVDVTRFGSGTTFESQALAASDRIRNAEKAPGTDRLFAPGEPEWNRMKAAGGMAAVNGTVWASLVECAESAGVAVQIDSITKES